MSEGVQRHDAWHPTFVSNPGETIKETMQALGLSRGQLAARMGYPVDAVKLLVAGRHAITGDTAERLEEALHVPASFWRERQRRYNRYKAHQRRRILRQLNRAQSRSRIATLTLREWKDALAHFQGRCAYCNEAPSVMLDHYLPVSKGGGTTADNCVPACRPCDARKGNLHPDEFVPLFPPEQIQCIQAYFASICSEEEHCFVGEERRKR